ncbi:MAG: T9SS type A sorting domain-containing protein [Muribaculaceae bacterium]|nr:T9SS type A sorting domain-containing protein [Muribaculaceae bacterium]
MKKITLFLLSGMLPVLASGQAKTVPYASGLYQDSDWTVVDVNKDSKTWTDESSSYSFSGSGYTTGKKFTYHSSNSADDWFISPAITLEAGKEYKVKFFNKNTYAERLEVKVATSNDVEELASGVKIAGYEDAKHSGYIRVSGLFTPEQTGEYFIGIHAYSTPNQGWIYITGFEVVENVFAPASVSKLTCTPGEERALTATLAWELPTTDNDGAALPEGASFDEVTIVRDGKTVASLDGTATSWTDTEATGLTPGKHSYEVSVVVNGAKSAPVKVDSKYIGPVQAQVLPFDANVKAMTQEDFDLLWTPVKGRESASTANWEFKVSSYYGNSIQYCGGSGKRQDDWVISPSMKFAEAGIYRLSVKMSYNTSSKTRFDILLGRGSVIGGYETVIKNFTSIPSTDTDYEIIFPVESPGEYGIAFHAYDETGSYNTYCIRNFVVEKWVMTPAQVADLTATVNDDATVSLAWTNPARSNVDTDLTSLAKVELYCDGELAETFGEAAPGAAMTYVHTPAAAGVHTYHVVAYSVDGPADGEPVKVTTGWVGDETQELPYTTSFASTDPTVPIWSGLNANEDGSEWVIKNAAVLAVNKDGGYGYRNNDYLLSPYFNLTPGYYKVVYSIKGAGKNVEMKIGTVSDKNDVAATFTQLGTVKLPGQSYASDYTVVFKIETEGRYAIALLNDMITSSSDYDTQVTKFSLAVEPVLPQAVTDLVVTPDPDMGLYATVSWMNPAQSTVEGVVPELVKAEVSRNGEVVATITEGLAAGATADYVDEVPNAGEYTYSVTVYTADGASKATTVKSPWIGAGMDLPWNCDESFSQAGWTMFNINNDKYTDGSPKTWETNSSSIYILSTAVNTNDWAITPRLNFNDGHVYTITVKAGYSSEAGEFDLVYGTALDPEAMTVPIATVNVDTHKYNEALTEQTFKVKAVNPAAAALMVEEAGEEDNVVVVPAGVGTIGLHANKPLDIVVKRFAINGGVALGIVGVESDKVGGVTLSGSTVSFGSTADEVAVVDLAGKTVMAAADADSISLAGLAKGVYLVRATFGNEIVTVKVLNR